MKEGEIRIYVACLAAYNNGILHGCWMDADREPPAIYDDIRALLRSSPIPGAEEWAIHDYEGFECIRLSEYEGIERVAETASLIAEHGRLGAELVGHLGGIDEARQALEDCYHGVFSSLAEYVQELTEECAAVPEQILYYIDWHAMARDAEMSGDLFTIQTAHDEIHVFSGL